MKLILKQRRFTLRDRFTVEDAKGKDKYEVFGELLETTKHLHIRNMDGEEVASIQERRVSFRERFFLVIRGEEVGEIVKEKTLFGTKYHITGLDWKIKGDGEAEEFDIYAERKKIATFEKKFFSFTDKYVLEIDDDVDELPALAAILAVDYIAEVEEEK